MPVLKLATAYFAMVFAVGFALGTARVLWLVPSLGERTAELIEAPLMLAAVVVAARYAVRRWGEALSAVGLLIAGMTALGLLVVLELTVVLRARGLTLDDYLAARDPVSGTVYLASLALFGLMPLLMLRFTRRQDEEDSL